MCILNDMMSLNCENNLWEIMTDHINLINPQAISEYLDGLSSVSENSDDLSKLLICALDKPLRKELLCMHPVSEMPDDAPDWLRKKWGKVAFYTFVPDQSLKIKIEHVRDWLQASLSRSERWIQNVDELGRPLKLLKIGKLDQALKEADKYSILQRQKYKDSVNKDAAFEYELEHEDISIVKKYDNGFQMVQIFTKIGAVREAYLMQHCLADGAYDKHFVENDPESDVVFYSLRDAKNHPHVTIHVNRMDGSVFQCVGKQNSPPVEKYIPHLMEFMKDKRFCVDSIAWMLGFVQYEGNIYKLDALPNDYVFQGFLDITKIPNFVCPNNLTVKDYFVLNLNQRHLLKTCANFRGGVREDEQLDNLGIKCIYHTSNFERVYSEVWYLPVEERFEYHRTDGGAARTDYDKETGNIILEEWHWHGALNREGGPARIIYDKETGKITSKEWFRSGAVNREGAPAYIQYDKETGKVLLEEYYFIGKLHREDGPSYLSYDEKSGQCVSKKWYSQGKLHNDEGGAVQNFHSKTGEVLSEVFYIDGKIVYNQQGDTIYGEPCTPVNAVPTVFKKSA